MIRGVACETAIASTESVCLTLNNQEFLELIRQYPAFKAVFQDQCALIELFDLLGTQLERQAQGETDLRELSLNTIADSQVYYVPPGRHKLSAHLPLQDKNYLWLVSGGEIAQFSVGSALPSSPASTELEIIGPQSARLVGVPKSASPTLALITPTEAIAVPQVTVMPADDEPLRRYPLRPGRSGWRSSPSACPW